MGVVGQNIAGVLVEATNAKLITSVREFVKLLEQEAGFRASEGVKLEVFLAA